MPVRSLIDAEHVADRRAGEADRQRIARRRVENRLGGLLARLLAELLDRGPGARRLDALADQAVELGHLRGGLAVGRVVFGRPPPFQDRGVELTGGFEPARRGDVLARGRQHRPLEGDAVVGALGRLLHRLAQMGDRRIPVARAPPLLAAPERAARRTPREHDGERHERGQSGHPGHCPVNRIVWRPRPSRYDISTDSTPMRTIWNRPSMASPSWP